MSLALHPNKTIVATGQKSQATGFSDIFLWNAETLEAVGQISGFHRCSVGQLMFSPNGSCLLTIGQDKDNCIAIYDWRSGALICATKTGNRKIIDIDWKND